ncbi:uncharacterized protein J3R85_012711 [Psidium guajava]|nr:uncharacterized protein J3R85_012711 [Psidium guajava]
MALNPPFPQGLRFSFHSPSPSSHNHHHLLSPDFIACSHLLLHCPPWPQLQLHLAPRKSKAFPYRARCVAGSAEEGRWSDSETLVSDGDDDDGRVPGENGSSRQRTATASSSSDYLSIGIREPVYEVVEVKSNGMISTRKINRRHLLKSGGLRPRDIRSVDPSLWLINSMPSLLVRDRAILLNLGSLRAIAMPERVLLFNYKSSGGKAFIDSLLPRLNPDMNGGHCMPFELEVVEAALISRIQRYEQRLMNVEPRVLPNRLTADILEELRLSKQTLVLVYCVT